MLKNASRLTWIEDQIRHKTLQVSYLPDESGGSDRKRSLKHFRDDGESENKACARGRARRAGGQ